MAPRARARYERAMRSRLYLITPSTFELDDFALALHAAMMAGDVAAVQLRMKAASDDAIRAAAKVLMPLVQDAGGAFIVNDRPDLAYSLKADGVHVGQQDMPYADARRLLGPDAIVGVTCHASRHLAMEAAEQGADYVAFGAFFASDTKDSGYRADTELLEIWRETTDVPCVAIGGITADNCEPLVRAGADFIAVANGVWKHPEGPAAAVRAFNAIFDRNADAI